MPKSPGVSQGFLSQSEPDERESRLSLAARRARVLALRSTNGRPSRPGRCHSGSVPLWDSTRLVELLMLLAFVGYLSSGVAARRQARASRSRCLLFASSAPKFWVT